jgi:hypothetical protein
VICDVEALAPRNAVTRPTPGPGHWEINLATIVERSMWEQRTEQPLADINYGVGVRDDRTRFRLYAGLQFNLPGQYSFGSSPTVTGVRPR